MFFDKQRIFVALLLGLWGLVSSLYPASLTAVSWEKRADAVTFRLQLDSPTEYRLEDHLQQDGYLSLLLQGLDKAYEQRRLETGSDLLPLVIARLEPGTNHLRFFLFPKRGSRFRLYEGEGGRRLEVAIYRGAEVEASRKIIIIDPGHGGKSRGARSPYKYKGRYMWEKELVLSMGKRLKKLIDQSPNLEAYLTRTRDEYVGLNERIRFAGQRRGDMFVSIHCNAVRGYRAGRARGIEFYYWSERGSQNEATKYLEELENDLTLPVERQVRNEARQLIQSLLTDRLTEMKEESCAFCGFLSQSFRKLSYFRRYYRGIKSARFKVLANYEMPAVLIEVGFMSNTRELNYLVQPTFQEQIARAIYNAIQEWFGRQSPDFIPQYVALSR